MANNQDDDKTRPSDEEAENGENLDETESLSDEDLARAETILDQAEEDQKRLQEQTAEQASEVEDEHLRQLLEWRKKEQERLKHSKDFDDIYAMLDDITAQLLLSDDISSPEAQAQKLFKKQLQARNKEENWKKRLIQFYQGFYKPAIGVSFPYHTAVAKLWNDRVQELRVAELPMSIRLKFLEQAYKAGDKFNAQVLLLALAMGSDISQKMIDDYWEAFGKKRKFDDPNNPSGTIEIDAPATAEEFFFETKLRSVGRKEGNRVDIKNTSRFAQDSDENGKITLQLRSREEIAGWADINIVEFGGRRTNVAAENFIYNTITSKETAGATNKFLRYKLEEVMPQQIQKIDDKIILLEQYAQQNLFATPRVKVEIEKLNTQKTEFSDQMALVEQVLDSGGYEVSDIKTFLLDPLSDLEAPDIKIDGKPVKERDLAADISFIKYMTGKTAADTRITVEGEHALAIDVDAFQQMMSVRRRGEYAWANSHSMLGARVPSSKKPDVRRDAYKNLCRALSPAGMRPEYRNFALTSQGFYVDKLDPRDEHYHLITYNKEGTRLVRVMEWDDEIGRNLNYFGYLANIPVNERGSHWEKKVKEAEARGDYVDGEGATREQALGKMGSIVVGMAEQDEPDVDRVVEKMAYQKDKLDNLGEIISDESDIPEIKNSLPAYLSSLIRGESGKNGIDNILVQDLLDRVYKEKFNQFSQAELKDEKGEAILGVLLNLLEQNPSARDQEVQDVVSSVEIGLDEMREKAKEEGPRIYDAFVGSENKIRQVLPALNRKLTNVCLAMVLQKAVVTGASQKFVEIKTHIGETFPKDFSELKLDDLQSWNNLFANKLRAIGDFRKGYTAVGKTALSERTLGEIECKQSGKTAKSGIDLAKEIFGDGFYKEKEYKKKDDDEARDIKIGELQLRLNYYELIYSALIQEIKVYLQGLEVNIDQEESLAQAA
ncbi:MAG: hypothetical protein CEN89_170 [Candidatus Berkelbacteria bacterium Licking1014_7]|uniref:Uncharacterized protein n=1 Tax=Candidatus Berkelbacteria bacterium Licking1014_7 TaxID=2017147 RepID=A0A554LK57_9BACT|nr:MAG: hypothetical protein CEN89_170 [Candidatus Berkelbacteria bacterium Licking1014_7]